MDTNQVDRKRDLIQAFFDNKFEIVSSQAWSDLDELSTHTTVDEIQVDPADIILEGNRFQGLANIYVTLQYGQNDEDGFSEADSFTADFAGYVDGHNVVLERFKVDTSQRFSEDDSLFGSAAKI